MNNNNIMTVYRLNNPLSLFLFCLLFLPFFSVAQTPEDIQRIQQQNDQIIQQQNQRLEQENQQRLDDDNRVIIELPKPSVNDNAIRKESLCFEINSIDVKGVVSISNVKLEKTLLKYNSRCLSLAHINELLKAITGLYFDRGYVTSRAYLPKQDLSTGTLTIRV